MNYKVTKGTGEIETYLKLVFPWVSLGGPGGPKN